MVIMVPGDIYIRSKDIDWNPQHGSTGNRGWCGSGARMSETDNWEIIRIDDRWHLELSRNESGHFGGMVSPKAWFQDESAERADISIALTGARNNRRFRVVNHNSEMFISIPKKVLSELEKYHEAWEVDN